MAPTTTRTGTQQQPTVTTKPPRPRVACFSFAAYAKNLIENLKSCNIPVSPGLTDREFSSIESTFRFTFPPDLRSILQVGLPVGPQWPNWRSSSQQQLHILSNLPALCVCKNVSQNNFWSDSWGHKPDINNNDALSLVKQLLKTAPVLVPIYRNCYIPSSPNLAGNPVFYVDDKEVCVLSFDVSGFFQEIEQLLQLGPFFKPLFRKLKNGGSNNMNTPAWAATEAREIEFWTDLAERGRRVVARGSTQGWWSGMGLLKLEGCLEEAFWKLRDGGWTEEEVKDMMIEMDGCDENKCRASSVTNVEEVVWHLRVLSLMLLRAGWSTEDVVYSLDIDNGTAVIS